jgi:plasmid stabilization system protein ParE
MLIYKIEVAPSVIEELEEIALYIALDKPPAALAWYEGMEKRIKSLETSPLRCPVAEESQYFDYEIRKLIVGNYRILFRVDGLIVKILHVLGGAQEREPF